MTQIEQTQRQPKQDRAKETKKIAKVSLFVGYVSLFVGYIVRRYIYFRVYNRYLSI